MRYLRTTLRCGVPYGVIMAGIMSVLTGWRIGVAVGLLGGLCFGASMAVFAGRMRRRFQIDRPNFTGEQMLWEGPANHFLHGEGVGGWLYLTTRRLLFRSHRFNLQPHELNLPLAEIAEASPALTAWFIPNGLLVRTVSGGWERFVVEQRRRWTAEISRAKEALAEPVSGGANAG